MSFFPRFSVLCSSLFPFQSSYPSCLLCGWFALLFSKVLRWKVVTDLRSCFFFNICIHSCNKRLLSCSRLPFISVSPSAVCPEKNFPLEIWLFFIFFSNYDVSLGREIINMWIRAVNRAGLSVSWQLLRKWWSLGFVCYFSMYIFNVFEILQLF